MERKAKVDALLKANAGWGEGDREFLMEVEEAQFAKIESQVAETATLKANAARKPRTADEFIADLPEGEMRESISHGLKLHKSRKASLVEALKANDRVKARYDEARLKTLSLAQLEEIADLAGIEDDEGDDADFSGRTALKDNEDADAVPAMPKLDFSKK